MELSVLSFPVSMVRETKQRSSVARRVLIVEQQPSIVEILHWALKLKGYEISEVSGKDWIDQTLVGDNDYLAIVLDLSIESWFNRDAIIQCLEQRWNTFHTKKLPLIVLTTVSGTERSLNGYPIVRKPFHIGELLAEVELLASQNV
ncbi:MAG: hypothetical protein E6J34_21275 [Chloroflexi bacterium]|nr:MAG: hypothetical protein E6J34_21275 [Chloroflexota bacterium]